MNAVRYIEVTVQKTERYTLYQSYCSKKTKALPSIKVTFWKKQTLYAISKLNFEKTEYYTLYRSYLSK